MSTATLEPSTSRRTFDRVPAMDRLFSTVIAGQAQTAEASQKDPNTGVSYNRRLVLPLNPWKMRAHMSATQSIPGTGEPATVVNLDTVDFDSASGFNTSTHKYTVPIAGFYQINAKCHMTVGAWGYLEMIGRVYQNGVRISEGFQTNAGDFTSIGGGGFITQTGYSALLADVFFFNAGDTIDLRCAQVNSAAAAGTLQANLFTYLSMHLVSG